jgi:hypothetical protein
VYETLDFASALVLRYWLYKIGVWITILFVLLLALYLQSWKALLSLVSAFILLKYQTSDDTEESELVTKMYEVGFFGTWRMTSIVVTSAVYTFMIVKALT